MISTSSQESSRETNFKEEDQTEEEEDLKTTQPVNDPPQVYCIIGTGDISPWYSLQIPGNIIETIVRCICPF